MRYLVLLCVAFITVDFISAADEAQSVPSLPVVTTWGELGSLQPTLLADGSEVRLGIQRLDGPVGSAVAVYVLTPQTTALNVDSDGETCGPVGVMIGDRRCLSAAMAQRMCGTTEILELYAHLVPLRQSGPLNITIFGQRHIVLAKATITAKAIVYQRWSTCLPSPSQLAALETAPDEPDLIIAYSHIGVGPGSAAVPATDGTWPWSSIDDTDLQNILAGTTGDLALPVPEPLAPHPLFHAEGTPTGVTLTVPALFFSNWYGSIASEQILARWWKNGQPWLPSATDVSDWSGQYAGSDPIPGPKDQLRLQLTIDADEWPQERIEVQFMLTPDGYSLLDQDTQHAELAAALLDYCDAHDLSRAGTYLSQRVTLLPR